MIIANIETFPLRISFKSGTQAAASAWDDNDLPVADSLLVRVTTDQGLEGWGETFGFRAVSSAQLAIEELIAPTLRDIVEIQQLQGRSIRETAEAMGISSAAARGRPFHARVELRKSLAPKLVHQPRFASGFVSCPQGNSSRSANARTDQ